MAVASLRTSPPPFFLVFIFFQKHNKKQRGRPTLQSLRDSPFSPKPVGTFISRAVRLRVSFSLCSDCLAGTPSMVSGVYAISFFVLAHWLRQILYSFSTMHFLLLLLLFFAFWFFECRGRIMSSFTHTATHRTAAYQNDSTFPCLVARNVPFPLLSLCVFFLTFYKNCLNTCL